MSEERRKIRYVGVDNLNDLVARIKQELNLKTITIVEEYDESGKKTYVVYQGPNIIAEITFSGGADYEFMSDDTIDDWFTEQKEG